jgi:hypothetical protein
MYFFPYLEYTFTIIRFKSKDRFFKNIINICIQKVQKW